MAFIQIHYHDHGAEGLQTVNLKIDSLMTKVAEVLAKIAVIKEDVATINASVQNIDQDVKGLVAKIEGGEADLTVILGELNGMSDKTGTLATVTKAIADSVEDVEEPIEE